MTSSPTGHGWHGSERARGGRHGGAGAGVAGGVGHGRLGAAVGALCGRRDHLQHRQNFQYASRYILGDKMLDPVDLDLMDLYPNSKLPSNRQAVMNLRGCRRVLLDRGPSVVSGVGLGLGGHRLLKVSIHVL